ncbi:MAG: serine/threonine protein kinase [Gallionellales bacterium GWA2_59_43]|nr:MAG: serine/threonine protein kinase [Gallionellales bacterium GWA2_59_43]
MISQLGRYEILGELGQGAMGVVYKAKDPLIDRVVAIKTINLGLALDEKEEYEGRFYQEAKAAGRLNHPNIVTIYDVGKSGDVAYIAMEFLQGRELRDIMNDGGLLPVDQVLDIVAQVALGLSYAHEHEIVHRDVKPSNIMVVRDGHVKITDFGIARMASSAVRTQTGMVLGSPKYMSPEQVMGKNIDQRSDIFSLGVMLYEMLTGQAPFNGDNVNAIMYQTLNAAPSPPNLLNPGVPEMLNFIVAKALAKAVDDRYQNAKDFAADLRACRDTLPRSGQALDVSKSPAGGEKKLPDAITVTGSRNVEEDVGAISTAKLSQAFDSGAATMRLAALTTSPAEVDELSKTLKLVRPSAEAINRNAPVKNAAARLPPAAVSRSASRQDKSEATGTGSGVGNFLLVVIVALVLLGIAAIFI